MQPSREATDNQGDLYRSQLSPCDAAAQEKNNLGNILFCFGICFTNMKLLLSTLNPSPSLLLDVSLLVQEANMGLLELDFGAIAFEMSFCQIHIVIRLTVCLL